jgi:hypothetical protein
MDKMQITKLIDKLLAKEITDSEFSQLYAIFHQQPEWFEHYKTSKDLLELFDKKES